ncbi:hypothetical protein ACFYO1_03390 [Nocardia sp. NPDC006044]|uniref:hypothetical protein n=1 Tax=Nocardia sp. NPDC006044 TaxID=3364306 RepID=UPI00369E6E90
MIDNPDVPPAVYAEAGDSQTVEVGEPGTIGPLTVAVDEGLLSFTAKLEPLSRWSNNPLDRWSAGNNESVPSSDSRLDPLERWGDR